MTGGADRRALMVIPVDDVDSAVRWYSTLLGREPEFVDGTRWAQFGGASSIALAGPGAGFDLEGPALAVRCPTPEDMRTLQLALRVAAAHENSGPHGHSSYLSDPAGNPVVAFRRG